MVVLAITDLSGIQAIVRRLEKLLSERAEEAKQTAVTLSDIAGMATYPEDGVDAQALLTKATQSIGCGDDGTGSGTRMTGERR